MQAVQASDYAVGEFKALWRLLLVHGRFSYIRVSEMILYFFYKNIVFTLPQFFFSFDCAFSGETIFDDWYITFFNMLFTCLPVVVFAITNQDVYFYSQESDGTTAVYKNLKKSYPLLYFVGQRNQRFNKTTILSWLVQGSIHSLLIYLTVKYALQSFILNRYGQTDDLWSRSILLYTTVIICVNVRLMTCCKFWSWTFINSILISSLLFYFVYIWIADNIDSFPLYQTAQMIFSSFYFYATILLCCLTFLLVDVLVEFIKMEFFTDLIDYFRFLVKNRKVNKRIFFENLDDYISQKKLRNSYFIDPDTPQQSTIIIKEENKEMVGLIKPSVDSRLGKRSSKDGKIK